MADHVPQRLVNGLLVVLARVVHRREIAAGDEGDLVTVAVVIGGQQPPRIFVLLAIVVECEPADGPRHPAAGTTSLEGFPPGSYMGRSVVGRFVLADRVSGRDLDLVHAHNRNVSEEPAA